MANMWARNNLKDASAHPGLEAQLQVLPAPDVEAVIVSSQTVEELLADAEESASHGGRGDWNIQ